MPRWKELKRFCERDGWELYKDTDHYFYRKIENALEFTINSLVSNLQLLDFFFFGTAARLISS